MLASIGEANADLPYWPPFEWAKLAGPVPGHAVGVDEIVARRVAGVDLDALGKLDDVGLLLPVLAEAVNDWAFSEDEIAAAVLLEAGT